MKLPLDPESIKGFLHPEEGACLYRYALAASALGPCLEVGSYCGKSTLYMGTGAVSYTHLTLPTSDLV